MRNMKNTGPAISCTECQRRKQKCSREWPCNHCQARKVPHLCQPGQRRAQQEPPIEQSTAVSESQGQKRSLSNSPEIFTLALDSAQNTLEDGLKTLGYLPGHVHYSLRYADNEVTNQKNPLREPSQNQEVNNVLHVFPSRSITDAIVNHFLVVVNHRYNAIYAPTFTEQYVQWWSDRASSKSLSSEFTCLLLRVCAYSSQYLSAPLRKMVEFELSCNTQVITNQFDVAADQLSTNFETSRTSLERVQELFLKSAWLKSESRMVESWHMLGRAIHEAQELGINRDSGLEGLTSFEKEIRRCVWVLLYLWDWLMSSWLCRPHLIDQKDCSFTFPSLRLEETASDVHLPSPFTHISLQARLARRIAQIKGDIKAVGDLTANQVLAIEAECEDFIGELPPVFRFEHPDLSFDTRHPYYISQRRQLHVSVYMIMFDFLKPYLTRNPRDPKSLHDTKFRNMGIEIGLKLLRKSQLLFDHEFPINARFHLVVFSLFDSATVLSSAVIHDIDGNLPHREQVMDAIQSTLSLLGRLSITKIGSASYNFLLKLVRSVPALSRWILDRKRRRIEMDSTSSDSHDVNLSQTSSRTAESALIYTPTTPIPETPTKDDVAFDIEQFLADNPFGDERQPGIEGLEEIWDWDTLNLDEFLNHDSIYDVHMQSRAM